MPSLTIADLASRSKPVAKKRWIQKATSEHKGAFKAKAERAGETTREYAADKKDAPGALGKEARLATTLMGMHKKAPFHKHPKSPG